MQLSLDTALTFIASSKEMPRLGRGFAALSHLMYEAGLNGEPDYDRIERVIKDRFSTEQDVQLKWWMLGLIAEIVTPAKIATLSRLQKQLSGVVIDEITALIHGECVLPDILAGTGSNLVRALEAAVISSVEGARECLSTLLLDNLYFDEFTIEEANQAIKRLVAMKL